jgi:glycosyltransferase involved in cell wall biosynthesis
VRISVITACFNNATTIADTLDSIARQRDVDIEHIVIDGGSTDGTLAVIGGHAWKPARVVSERDDGVYYAMNKGLALATGDAVGFLNADDIYADQDVLADVGRALSDPAVDACYADLIYVDADDVSRTVRYWQSNEYSPGLCLQGWMPAHPTFYARKRVYERFGGFDCEFRRQSDFELTTRLLEKHRIRCTYVPRVWVKMRTGGISNRSAIGVLKGNVEAYRAMRKLGFAVPPWFIIRKVASRLPQFFDRPGA